MSLRKNTQAQPFEQMEDESDIDATEGSSTVEKVEQEPTKAVATVTAKTSALAPTMTAASVMKTNIISGLKNAFQVEWDTLPSVVAELDGFVIKANNDLNLGKEISIQIMSYQDSFVASPNDKKADKELVKYSDDGVTAKDGTDMRQHIEDLKEQGYSRATVSNRMVLVGELLTEGFDLTGQLVQVNLSDTGRRSFNSYTVQASFAVAKGRKTQEEATRVLLSITKGKTNSGEVYPKVVVS